MPRLPKENLPVDKKRCTKCLSVYPRSNFWNTKNTKDGLQCKCKRCHGEAYFIGKYGINREGRKTIISKQNGICANPLCGKTICEVSAHLDHNHSTGKIRGALCLGCNMSLGLLGEDQQRISGLVIYLQKHQDV